MHTLVNNTAHAICITDRKKVGRNEDGSPEFEVRQVNVKPGSNVLDADQAELVQQQRKANPGVRARFDRIVEKDAVTRGAGQIGRPELEFSQDQSRRTLERFVRECSDPNTLRLYRQGFASDPALASLCEDRLAACTVTTDGKPVAADVKRDPSDPRKGAR